MKIIVSFYIILFVIPLSSGCQRKTISNGPEISNYIDEDFDGPNLIKSPNGDYAFFITNENKIDISTVIIIYLEDSSLVFKRNFYLDSASWITDHVVRIYNRPEMIRTDKTENLFFDYRVEEENHQKR